MTPNAVVKVIIQSDRGAPTAQNAFQKADSQDGALRDRERVKDSFGFTGSVAVSMKAKKVLMLARIPG